MHLLSRSKFFLNADYKFHLFSPHRNLPFKDDSIDIIYCSHVIEHLPSETFNYLFDEFHRVLKYNGIVRVILPDIERAMLSCLAEEGQGSIDIGEQLGTLPHALRSSRLRMMVESLFGFPSLHKTLITSKNVNNFFDDNSKWLMKQSLRFMESDIHVNLLNKIETESRCKGSLIFELRKKTN
jgi:predicted SAM-dependent methyltransferase